MSRFRWIFLAVLLLLGFFFWSGLREVPTGTPAPAAAPMLWRLDAVQGVPQVDGRPCHSVGEALRDGREMPAMLETDAVSGAGLLAGVHRLVLGTESRWEGRSGSGGMVLVRGGLSWSLLLAQDEPDAGGSVEGEGDLMLGEVAQLRFRGRGRVVLASADRVWIWNHGGVCTWTGRDGQTQTVPPRTLLRWKGEVLQPGLEMLEAPVDLDPSDLERLIRQPQDQVLHLSWGRVAGAQAYLLRFYDSLLMTQPVHQVWVDTNRWAGTVAVLPGPGTFFWQVVAGREQGDENGVPSLPARLNVSGLTADSAEVSEKPHLEIRSVNVGGNVVIIRGKGDPAARLTVNGQVVVMGGNGDFVHTISFQGAGVRTLEFRLVSPRQTETVVTREVVLFDE